MVFIKTTSFSWWHDWYGTNYVKVVWSSRCLDYIDCIYACALVKMRRKSIKAKCSATSIIENFQLLISFYYDL